MLAYDPSANPLNNTEWAFPLTECFHIGAMALSIGTIALVDLRLLGFGLTRQTASRLSDDTEYWTLAGLTIVIASGLMIFSSDPVAYVRNRVFWFKMTMLLVAIAWHYAVRRRVARGAPTPLTRTLVASISLVLWCSLIFSGIFIAFV